MRIATLAGLVLGVMLATLACRARITSDQVIMVKGVTDDGFVKFEGRMTFKQNPVTGKLEPDYWKPTTLYLFRVATDKVGGISAKRGEIYRVGSNKELTKAGLFDESKSDDELEKQYSDR
jgi:hypothetical protein